MLVHNYILKRRTLFLDVVERPTLRQLSGRSLVPFSFFAQLPSVSVIASRGKGRGAMPLNITDLQLGDLGGRRLERHLSRAAAPRVGGVNVEVEAAAEAVVGAQAPAKSKRKS